MAHSETFSPDITVVKNVYEDYSQYVLIMDGKYIAQFDTRDQLMAGLEVMLQGVIE